MKTTYAVLVNVHDKYYQCLSIQVKSIIFVTRDGIHTFDYSRLNTGTYFSYTALLDTVLKLAENNGYKIPSYKEFNALWYKVDIVKQDGTTHRYPYLK